jgi:tetratricopeptide (TPR) repeat protein
MELVRTQSSLQDEATTAYEAGHYLEAALLYEQMREQERGSGQDGLSLRATVWGGMCYQLAGKPVRAMSLFTEALKETEPHGSPWYRWLAHIQLFEVLRDYLGDLQSLIEQLDRLNEMKDSNACWTRSDVLWLEAGVLEAQGQWDEASRCLEQAWACGRRSFMKFLISEYAVRIHLAAGRADEARQWSAKLGETERYFSESRVADLEAQGRLALWSNDLPELERITGLLEHEAEGLQRPLWEGRAVRLQIRTHLLRPELGDPASPLHPASRLLRIHLHGGITRDERFQRQLLVLDYRLACLRYAVGLAPQETLYGWRNSEIVEWGATRVGKREIEQRMRKATQALESAHAKAQSLDDCFDCDWREREVQLRQHGLEALTHGRGVLCRTV